MKILLLHDSYADLIDSTRTGKSPFRPGMSATVDIMTLTRSGILAVPVQAVTTRLKNDTTHRVATVPNAANRPVDDEKEEVVFRIKDNRAYKAVVISGIQNNTHIEITEGLTEGEQIVTGPYNAVSKTLKDSMLVKIVTEAELYKTDEK